MHHPNRTNADWGKRTRADNGVSGGKQHMTGSEDSTKQSKMRVGRKRDLVDARVEGNHGGEEIAR